MLNCWDEDYLKRLKFREIEAKLKELIEDSNLLLSTLKKRFEEKFFLENFFFSKENFQIDIY